MHGTGKLGTMKRSMALAALGAALGMPALAPTTALASEPFVGEIRFFGFNFAPLNWATCSGQVMSIAQNDVLFALVGTTYGGDGQNTFNLPDMRGRIPLHMGQGPGLSPRTIGEKAGSETTTLTVNNLPSHNHAIGPVSLSGALSATLNANSAVGDNHDPAGNAIAPAGAAALGFQSAAPNVSMNAGSVTLTGALTGGSLPASTGPSGSSLPVSNIPPYTAINCSIALFGVFPSRN